MQCNFGSPLFTQPSVIYSAELILSILTEKLFAPPHACVHLLIARPYSKWTFKWSNMASAVAVTIYSAGKQAMRTLPSHTAVRHELCKLLKDPFLHSVSIYDTCTSTNPTLVINHNQLVHGDHPRQCSNSYYFPNDNPL